MSPISPIRSPTFNSFVIYSSCYILRHVQPILSRILIKRTTEVGMRLTFMKRASPRLLASCREISPCTPLLTDSAKTSDGPGRYSKSREYPRDLRSDVQKYSFFYRILHGTVFKNLFFYFRVLLIFRLIFFLYILYRIYCR